MAGDYVKMKQDKTNLLKVKTEETTETEKTIEEHIKRDEKKEPEKELKETVKPETEKISEEGTKKTSKKGKIILAISILFVCFFTFGVGWYLYDNRARGGVIEENGMENISGFAAIEDKIFQSRWVESGNGKYYLLKGIPVTGWQEIEGETYYFDDTGIMVTDKMVEKNRYVDSEGKLLPLDEIYHNGKEGLSELKILLRDTTEKYRGTWSIYVKNLDTNEYLCINDEEINSASMIKIYSMATTYEEIEKGTLKENQTITNDLYNMITVSDNSAYNHLLYVLGDGKGADGARLITDFCERMGYEETGCGSTLSSSETGYTAVWSFTNYTSTRDCGHILEDIYRGTLVSESASKEMLSLLKQQKHRSKIPAGLPENVVCANKTGEYGVRQHDAAIVYSKGADYIISIMTEGDGAAISHIQNVSGIVYQFFNE